MRNKAVDRRVFLKYAAGAISFPYIVSSSALGASEKITVGCVGVGPQGRGVMGNFLRQKDARVVAVCDVKDHVLKAAQQRVNEYYKGTGCTAYKDFRELMARDDIDGQIRKGRLSGKADGLESRPGPGASRCRAPSRQSFPVRHAAALRAQFPLCLRAGAERSARQAAHYQRMVSRQQPGRRSHAGARAGMARLRYVAGAGTVHTSCGGSFPTMRLVSSLAGAFILWTSPSGAAAKKSPVPWR